MIQLEQSVSVMESSLYQVGMSDNCSHGFNYGTEIYLNPSVFFRFLFFSYLLLYVVRLLSCIFSERLTFQTTVVLAWGQASRKRKQSASGGNLGKESPSPGSL